MHLWVIIGVFDYEINLFNKYPKIKSFKIKDIFNEYWYNFLNYAYMKNLKIRPLLNEILNVWWFVKLPI